MSELVVTGVHKNFGGVPVLCGLDLSVPAGSLAAVLGPSGCGKTTLLRLIAGFEQPDGGSITLGGRLVADSGAALPPEQRRVGIVPQEGALFPHLSVGGNVGFGLPRDRRRAGRIEEVLELVGLGGFKQRRPGELSGGQQQRVALARALAPAPALVLLDEPFSALDSGLRAALRDDVRMALQVSGATALLVTHDQQEALSMADLVAVVRAGRVVQCASPDELYSCPQDLGVATFVGDAVVLPAVLQEGWALTPLGRLPLTGERPLAGPGQVVVRPEQVQLLASGEGVPARVVGTDFYGHDAVVRLVLDDGRHTAVSARCQGRRPALAAVVGVRVAGAVTFFASSGAADR